jgi:hypothetical protein
MLINKSIVINEMVTNGMLKGKDDDWVMSI